MDHNKDQSISPSTNGQDNNQTNLHNQTMDNQTTPKNNQQMDKQTLAHSSNQQEDIIHQQVQPMNQSTSQSTNQAATQKTEQTGQTNHTTQASNQTMNQANSMHNQVTNQEVNNQAMVQTNQQTEQTNNLTSQVPAPTTNQTDQAMNQINQTMHNQSTIQASNQANNQAITHSNQITTNPVNQITNNQVMNQSTLQSTNQAATQTMAHNNQTTTQATNQAMNQQLSSSTNQTTNQIIPNIQAIKQLFHKCDDVIFQEFIFEQFKIHIVKCDGMINEALLYGVVIPKIEELFKKTNRNVSPFQIKQLTLPDFKQITTKETLIDAVFDGKVVIFFENFQLLYEANVSKKPNRNPEETNLEAIIKGPRDNFIESLQTNVAIIRKRMPTNSLCVEKLEVGRRTKTSVAILYLDDVADPNILVELKRQLIQIDTDIILSGDSLMEFVNKKKFIVPVTNTTGRPDFAVQSLARGRYVLFVEGSPVAVITPTNLTYMVKTSEDEDTPVLFNSFERLMRMIGILLGIGLPGFWLALTTFHQNEIPLQLLATVIISNVGIPFPRVLEMLILIVLFEMLREAGVRLPTIFGGTISVIGGLIIGDAAIRAGITSPAMLVIIATTTIASYTIVNQSLVTAVSILRIVFILVSAFLGLFGFFMCCYLLILYMANLRIFGTPYLNFTADLKLSDFVKSFIRLPKYQYKKRPKMLDPQDRTRKSG